MAQPKQHGRAGRLIELFSFGHALHSIIHSEIVRTILVPVVMTMATGTAGALGGVPLMWVIMASCVAFGSVSAGFLAVNAYKERTTPENKLRFNGCVFNFELAQTPQPNRKQRRATASATRRDAQDELQPQVREITIAQLGVELWSSATFPLSVILEDAESEFEGETPPRTKYPKERSPVLPGVPFRVCDTRMTLDNAVECGRLEGKCRFKIKYGHIGKEIYTMELRMRRVDILMDVNGFYRGNQVEWEEVIS